MRKKRKEVYCCNHLGLNPEPVTGLSFMPKKTLSTGKSCTVPSCNACPNMSAGTVGDPVLGNSSFAFTLNNAPSNASLGAVAIGFGSCQNVGVNLGLCDTLKVFLGPPPPMSILFGMTPTGAGCNANVKLPVPVPLVLAACGAKISVQWAMVCKALVGVGNGVTNCVTIEVGT